MNNVTGTCTKTVCEYSFLNGSQPILEALLEWQYKPLPCNLLPLLLLSAIILECRIYSQHSYLWLHVCAIGYTWQGLHLYVSQCTQWKYPIQT